MKGNDYRVIYRDGFYIAQEKGRIWGWNDMFACDGVAYIKFSTPAQAIKQVLD